jgi:hypothetical protein
MDTMVLMDDRKHNFGALVFLCIPGSMLLAP